MKTIFWLVGIILLMGCQVKYGNNPNCRINIDSTISPKEAYDKLKGCSPNEIDVAYLNYLSESNYLTGPFTDTQHLTYYKKLQSNSDGVAKAQAFIELSNGESYNHLTKFAKADSEYRRALNTFQQTHFDEGIAKAYNLLAINENYKGNYSQSFQFFQDAFRYYQQLGDTLRAYQIQSEMIIIYYKLKDYRPAVDISCSLLDYYIRKKDVYMQAYQESLLSVLYAKLQLYDSSKLLALRSLEKRKTFDNLHDIGESYNNLSLSQMGLKEWKEALVSLQLADSLMTKVGDERQLPIIRMNIAKAKIELGDFGAARQLLSQNIAATEQSGQKDILMANLNVLVTLCTKEGKYQEALAYTQQAQKLHDELFDFEKTKAINDLKNQIYQQQQKNTITQLRLEKTKRTYITLLVLVLALLVSTVLIFQYRKKRMQFLHQEAEIESHKQQLELLKDSIIKKNQLIESLEQTNIPSPKKQDENSEQLSELYQFKILTEDDWQAFKMLFDKVHPGLINRLRQNFPELTPAEERQFLLIQLKIDNKECANMLGISQPAVKKNRYRLKKRFNLGIEDNLDEFVYQFGQ